MVLPLGLAQLVPGPTLPPTSIPQVSHPLLPPPEAIITATPVEGWGAAGLASGLTTTTPQSHLVERLGTPPAPDPDGNFGGLLTKGKQLIISQYFACVVIGKFVCASGETWGMEVGGRVGPETS